MLTKVEAKRLVEEKLQEYENDDQFVITDEHTLEYRWGWVFFYNSQKYLETGEYRYSLAGNAPYIINKKTGEMYITGTGQPIWIYVLKYRLGLLKRYKV